MNGLNKTTRRNNLPVSATFNISPFEKGLAIIGKKKKQKGRDTEREGDRERVCVCERERDRRTDREREREGRKRTGERGRER